MPDEGPPTSGAGGAYIDLRGPPEYATFHYCIVSTGNNHVLATSETYPTRQHLDRAVGDFQNALAVHLLVRDSVGRGSPEAEPE
jgi:hypothetical protein